MDVFEWHIWKSTFKNLLAYFLSSHAFLFCAFIYSVCEMKRVMSAGLIFSPIFMVVQIYQCLLQM